MKGISILSASNCACLQGELGRLFFGLIGQV